MSASWAHFFDVCPNCGKKLEWFFVAVHGGGDPTAFLPEESFEYAECNCGLDLTRYFVAGELDDLADEDEEPGT